MPRLLEREQLESSKEARLLVLTFDRVVCKPADPVHIFQVFTRTREELNRLRHVKSRRTTPQHHSQIVHENITE
jgi:hypothetical protein